MPRVLQIVVSDNFAGVERYVSTVSAEIASRGWQVGVVGGNPQRMRAALDGDVPWAPGATPLEAWRSVRRLGLWDVCHVHMSFAEAVGVATRRMHSGKILSTRHFAARRGSSIGGRLAAPWIASGLSSEIAIGEFVASRLERAPATVIVLGVPDAPCLWHPASRTALVLQRLDPEKDTLTAIQAWQAAGLAREGWSLRIVGDGIERKMLEKRVLHDEIVGVVFTGWTDDVPDEFARAGLLLATAPAEPLGLAVLEAMAAGVPIAAAGSGGHLETVGLIQSAQLFEARDPESAANALRSLASDSTRAQLSRAGRELVKARFGLRLHVDRLLAHYIAVCEQDAATKHAA